MKIYDTLVNLDRRIIFLSIFLAVAIPIALKLTFPEFPTEMTRKVYNSIDEMPRGSRILFSFDYDPGGVPEIGPMTTAFVRHSLMKGHRLYFMALWPMGQQLCINEIENTIKKEFPDAVYGRDYVNLGYKAGGAGVIAVIATNIEKLYPADVNNTPLSQIPMMRGVKGLADFDIIASLSAGWPGSKEWIQFGTDPLGLKLITGATAANSPLLYPYHPKQLVGLLGGVKGAAEYEAIIRKKFERYADPKLHEGIIRWGPQTVVHIVIVVFIIFGNIMYFVDRRRRAKGGA